eukprot:jgi/Chlat1/7132/Chrsp57S06741
MLHRRSSPRLCGRALPLGLSSFSSSFNSNRSVSLSSSASGGLAGLAGLLERKQLRASNEQKRSQLIQSSASSTSSSSNSAPAKRRRKRLAVFVSGGGSNMKAIQRAIDAGKIKADIAAVVTDKPGCGGYEFAKEHGIETLIFPRPKTGDFIDAGLTPIELVDTLQQRGVDFVVLAGYLRLLPSNLCAAYKRRILNIHPALLPAFGGKGFYGMNVHRAVIKSGARYSGPTVHFVDEEYDAGPIVAQRVVPILPNDTPEDLAHREHQVYAEVVAALVEDRIMWREDGVPLIKPARETSALSL